MSKRSKKSKRLGFLGKMSTTKKVVIGLGVVAAAVVGYVLYKRSKQPGLSNQGA
jgi:hypothetical protein